MRKYLFILSLFSSLLVIAQTAQSILQNSISYHDPNGEWKTLKATFIFKETRPDGPDRKTMFTIDNARNKHTINRNDEEIYETDGSIVRVVKGSGNQERGKMLRNYYVYLWGLPMKLMDQGTSLSDKVGKKAIGEKQCFTLTVEYEKETWTYYIDQKNFALRAYGFRKNNGSGQEEFIQLEGEVLVGNMKLPKSRSWYDMPANKYLGTDTLESLK